ncbi:MAG: tRNA (N6-isopentenyl adenosine(37)-C2)-methylthiotransferase MiaB [Candidatus Omnitrophota bacterium]|nr:MAG: tRNA (N6-isopentenyl adenosine(37)-C2)-methylthiotransferase MiaB [Candidatus Omnitrophota bacterium]
MTKKVFIRTFGCQMNDRDSEALTGLFLEQGYSFVQNPEDADVILVNTCSVRAHAEDRALSFLGSLKALGSNGRVIGLIGCMAQNKGNDIFQKMPHINLICGPSSLEFIPEYVVRIRASGERIVDLQDRLRGEEFYRASYAIQPNHTQVVISTGCSNYCSYCVVPYVRGELRLRRPEDIIEEARRNVVRGIKKVTLLGQNVNDYRLPTIDFVKLLRMVADSEGIEEIDFVSAHPKNTSKELFELMAQKPNIKKHLHLPFQSGSNRILKLMNRGYTREDYLGLVSDYKKIVRGALSTDVIVGFPSETEDAFLQTKDMMERVEFCYAYIFKYSPRPGTAAAELKDDISQEEKERRHQILLNLQKSISFAYK